MRVLLMLAMAASCLCIAAQEDGTKEPAHCMRWRATSKCDPHGVREPRKDASCSQTIASGQAGYCECEHRRRVREVSCDHHPFTCQEACMEDASADLSYPVGFEYVTCGSSIKLVHENTRFRLHSHDIAYGTGSGQQSITAHGSRDDPNSFWVIKEGHNQDACNLGSPIQCGAVVRLEHVGTRRNLHTHGFPAPLSRKNQEISGFGAAGDGDRMDDWVVECEEAKQCTAVDQCEDDDMWKRGELVRLRSKATNKYMSTSPLARFDDSNCPRCPINGQQEVSAISEASDNTFWFADEGIYITI